MSPRDPKFLPSVGKAVKRLLRLLRIQRQPQSHARSPSLSPLPMVPVDVVEEILFYLSCQEILRMKQV